MTGWDKAPGYGRPPARPWLMMVALLLILAGALLRANVTFSSPVRFAPCAPCPR